jgi:hypothetical protein
VIDAKTGERQPIWSELNSVAENPGDRTLSISPGVGWREGRRYIAALRNLTQGGRQPARDHVPRELVDGAVHELPGRRTGRFVDNCGARPCYVAGWTGP